MCGSVSGDHEGFCLKAADTMIKKRKLTSYCVCRWEEEYTARMDLQEKVAELEEVTLTSKY